MTRLELPPSHVKYLGDYADSSLSSLDTWHDSIWVEPAAPCQWLDDDSGGGLRYPPIEAYAKES
jgi:hypothetical protein